MKFQPDKFELFKTETDFRLNKNCLSCTKFVGQKLFPVFGMAAFFNSKVKQLSD